jgi:hypothetical protein
MLRLGKGILKRNKRWFERGKFQGIDMFVWGRPPRPQITPAGVDASNQRRISLESVCSDRAYNVGIRAGRPKEFP